MKAANSKSKITDVKVNRLDNWIYDLKKYQNIVKYVKYKECIIRVNIILSKCY